MTENVTDITVTNIEGDIVTVNGKPYTVTKVQDIVGDDANVRIISAGSHHKESDGEGSLHVEVFTL